MTALQPMQPVELDDHGVARFRVNKILNWLFNTGRLDLNQIACMPDFSPEDRMQVAQLLGYSVSGYGDLSYVTDESLTAAEAAVVELVRED